MSRHILILEDDERLSRSLGLEFEEYNYEVTIHHKSSVISEGAKFTHALIDVRLANGEFGLEVLPHLIQKFPGIKIIVMSGYGSITTAVQAIKLGALDYLTKPVSFEVIEQAFNGNRLMKADNRKVRSLSEVENDYIDFVLTKNKGNITKTACDLGLHRQSLQRKLKKFP